MSTKEPVIRPSSGNSVDELIPLIRESGLFDIFYYRHQTALDGEPDALIRHYLEIGHSEKRSPNLFFDDNFYRATYLQNSDTEVANPFAHFVKLGHSQKRRPSLLFDPEYYLLHNRDIKESGIDPFLHFIKHGVKEGRVPSKDLEKLFDSKFYKAQVGEIESGLSPLEHYLIYGLANKRAPNQFFDGQYYLSNYPEVDVNPLLHYMMTGAKSGYRTHPVFDSGFYGHTHDLRDYAYTPLHHYLHFGLKGSLRPSAHFDPVFYTQCYPDVLSSGIDPALHFLQIGLSAKRLGAGGLPANFPMQNYIKMRETEPLLPESKHLKNLREYVVPVQSRVGRAYLDLADSIKQPFTHLFVLKWLQHGGADLVSTNYIRLVVDKLGPLAPYVILTSDAQNEGLDWLPDGVRCTRLSDLNPALTSQDKREILLKLIIQSRPHVVHNINSEECWNVYKFNHKQIAEHSKLIGCFFSLGRDGDNKVVGQASQYLNSCVDQLTFLFTDTQSFIDDLAIRYALEQEQVRKLVAIPTPSREEVKDSPPFPVSSESRKTILWASRFSPEKRPDILVKIARAMPQCTFKVWGGDYTNKFDIEELKQMPNVELCGAYTQFRDVVSSSGSYVFLYTSEFDGLPNVLLEAVATGLAVVAPSVGGISELITNETGWLIDNFLDVEAYVAALTAALLNDDERTRRLENARRLLSNKHSWTAFEKSLEATNYFD
jgi:glycosyltransferase involved in cell wall biosynthesis